MVPVADQQEGKQAGQLPEERDLDDVARQHHTCHRAHEGQKKRKEATITGENVKTA